MALNLRKLTTLLECSDLELNKLKIRIIKSLGDAKSLELILKQQCENQILTHCFSCENEGYCAILRGVAYLSLGDIRQNFRSNLSFDYAKRADAPLDTRTLSERTPLSANPVKNGIAEIESGNQHFRNYDAVWNNIVGLALLGIAYEKDGKKHQALLEYNKALHTLTVVYLRVLFNRLQKKRIAQALEKALIAQKQLISLPTPSSVTTIKTNSTHTYLDTPSHDAPDDKDYLALFSIPIYGGVEAGPDGELHIDHFDTFTIVNKVELQGQVFDVHSIHGTAPIDRQITVMTTRTHGWLRVHGLSMNGWDMPFNEDDYVLFYKASSASHLDYVIASNRDPSGEIALIVKRFNATNNQLLSKSKDTSQSYDPIPVNKDHQIIGIVIAVAKASN